MEEKKEKSRGRRHAAICSETGDHVHYAPTRSKRPRQTPSPIVKPPRFKETHYGECRKNQAADVGTTAYDGCGEFVSSTAGEDPLNCAACGCHRSFHLSDPTETLSPDQFRRIFCSPYGEEEGKSKRLKTKFTAEQTQRMRNYAEKLKWTVSPERREEANQFCSQIGIKPKSFRVWMNNHKDKN